MGANQRIIISTSLVVSLVLLVLFIRYNRYTDENTNLNFSHAKHDFSSDIPQPQVAPRTTHGNRIQETPGTGRAMQETPGRARGILTDDNKVRDCITGSVLRHHDDAPTNPFAISVFSSRETTKHRNNSFQLLYNTHTWGANADPNVDEKLKSVVGSGLGSTLNFAQEAMAVLHRLINELKRVTNKDKIKILDIPCGDFQWMYRFLQQRTDVLYTGMDIVPKLIENHSRAFKGYPDWRFVNDDVVVTPIKEKYDLVICRMMLQHLTTSDVMTVLNNIGDSGSKYLLTTTHLIYKQNGDLNISKRGRFRSINMELPPFTLVPPICISRDGPKGASLGHYLGLWKLPLRQLSKCNLHMLKRNEAIVEDIWVC